MNDSVERINFGGSVEHGDDDDTNSSAKSATNGKGCSIDRRKQQAYGGGGGHIDSGVTTRAISCVGSRSYRYTSCILTGMPGPVEGRRMKKRKTWRVLELKARYAGQGMVEGGK